MKTAHLIASTSLTFFLSGKLTAQSSLDGKEIAFPDRDSLIQWLSTDGIFTFLLVISFVSILIWTFYLLGTFLMTLERTDGQDYQKKRPRHALPGLRLPRVEIGLPDGAGYSAGLTPAQRKKKETPPDAGRGETQAQEEQPTRG